jgi:hypothetical protein
MQSPYTPTGCSAYENFLRYCILCDSRFLAYRKRITGSQDCAGYFSNPFKTTPPEAVELRLSWPNWSASFLALMLLALLAACDGDVQAPESRTRISTLSEIREVRLPDGTRCAVLIAGYAGGLSCDWRKP